MMFVKKIGKTTVIPQPELVNIYGCKIGKNCKIAAFVEIQDQSYRIKFYTPAQEIALCGHATLASAHVL